MHNLLHLLIAYKHMAKTGGVKEDENELESFNINIDLGLLGKMFCFH